MIIWIEKPPIDNTFLSIYERKGEVTLGVNIYLVRGYVSKPVLFQAFG